MSLTYEISNRVDWVNSWIIEATLPSEKDAKDEIFNSLSTAFHYYLTNSVTADARFSLEHLEDDIDDNGNDDVESRLFVGLTYRVR